MFVQETRARLALIADRGLERGKLILEVHSLKGAAATACAVSLSHRAACLEMRLKADDMLDEIDTAPLTEAFDAWLAAMGRAGATDAIAA
jgi:HPt (histidine-containing phosphotransfer) domain-containing protein